MKNPWKRYSKINPQREDGNIQINRDVLEKLISGDFTASEYKIIFFIIRKTFGYNKTSDTISASQFKKASNLSERMIKLATKNLRERRVIYYESSSIRVKQGSPINQFLFNKHYDTWRSRRVQRGSGVQSHVEKGAIPCKTRVQWGSPTIDTSTIDNVTIEKNTTSQPQGVQSVSPLETHSENHIPLKLSKKLFSLILQNDPKAKTPDFEKWSEHIEKLIRIDERTPEEITRVIQWVQRDDFWAPNILSTKKLRKQFPQLWIKFKKQGRCTHGKTEQFADKHYEGTPTDQIRWLNESGNEFKEEDAAV
jgi:phage replication O-like protein O